MNSSASSVHCFHHLGISPAFLITCSKCQPSTFLHSIENGKSSPPSKGATMSPETLLSPLQRSPPLAGVRWNSQPHQPLKILATSRSKLAPFFFPFLRFFFCFVSFFVSFAVVFFFLLIYINLF